MKTLPSFEQTPLEGLYLVNLDHRPDSRGWFEEVWQKKKWAESPLSNFYPVQQNASSNLRRGSTRGLHAEPWNKLVTVVSGKAFCAWVDLREGPGLGKSYYAELSPGRAFFVPKGLANGYQAIEDNTVYTYLVDDHWNPEARYSSVNLFDPLISIPWPIRKSNASFSEKDLSNPNFNEANKFPKSRLIVLGSGGQLGRALLEEINSAVSTTRENYFAVANSNFDYVINAAAFTRVDDGEKKENHKELFFANHELVNCLAKSTRDAGSVLIHFSSDYVFDGTKDGEWLEYDSPRPISKYGISKCLGDYAVEINPRHYLIRTSWVYGAGANFIRKMYEMASQHESVTVVNDQFGRPTSTVDLAKFTRYLIDTNRPFGIYNFSGSGEVVSWFELAKFVYKNVGANLSLVNPITTDEYLSTRPDLAARPTNSVLSLEKTEKSGFSPPNWQSSVADYLIRLKSSV